MIDLLKNILYILGAFFGFFLLGKKYGIDKERSNHNKKLLNDVVEAKRFKKKLDNTSIDDKRSWLQKRFSKK